MNITDWVNSLPIFWRFVYCLAPTFILYSWLTWLHMEDRLPNGCMEGMLIMSPVIAAFGFIIMVAPFFVACFFLTILSPILPWALYKLIKEVLRND